MSPLLTRKTAASPATSVEIIRDWPKKRLAFCRPWGGAASATTRNSIALTYAARRDAKRMLSPLLADPSGERTRHRRLGGGVRLRTVERTHRDNAHNEGDARRGRASHEGCVECAAQDRDKGERLPGGQEAQPSDVMDWPEV